MSDDERDQTVIDAAKLVLDLSALRAPKRVATVRLMHDGSNDAWLVAQLLEIIAMQRRLISRLRAEPAMAAERTS